MAMKILTISRHFPNAILHEVWARDPQVWHSLLAEQGLSRRILNEPRSRIPMDKYIALYRRGSAYLRDEAFGFLVHPLKPGTFAIACEYAANASDIGGALERLCHFYGIVTEDLALTLHRDGDSNASVAVRLKDARLDRFHFITELFLCIAYRLMCWMADQAIPLDRVMLSHTPPRHAAEYIFFFPCPSRFGIDGPSRLEFDARFLRLPVLKSGNDLRAFAERMPEDLLSSTIANDSFSNQVYLTLQTGSDDRTLGFAEVARELALSEQTLRRRLRAEASSFQTIKDDLRRDKAIFLLSTGAHTIADIAERLAFSSPAAFSRAFKKWTGLPPREYQGQASDQALLRGGVAPPS